MSEDMGASVPDQALVASDQAQGLGPSGFDPSRYDDMLPTAILLAAGWHDGQVDKAGRPYILHPLRVMLAMPDSKHMIAAVLHDVLEDCDVNPALVRTRFGGEIRDAVGALTREDGEPYGTFIERCGANSIARTVKLADLADNLDLSRLETITDADRSRQSRYVKARDRLLAIATETRRAETTGSVEDEGAGPTGHRPISGANPRRKEG
jgi:(p)ppGpp synthase/HD superfamily hydrolase